MLNLSGRSWQLATSPGTTVREPTIFWSCFYPTLSWYILLLHILISPFIPGRSLVHLCKASLVISASPKEHSPAHRVPPSGWITDNTAQQCALAQSIHCVLQVLWLLPWGSLGSLQHSLCGGQSQQLPQFSLLPQIATKCNMPCAWKPAGTAMPEVLGTPQRGEEGQHASVTKHWWKLTTLTEETNDLKPVDTGQGVGMWEICRCLLPGPPGPKFILLHGVPSPRWGYWKPCRSWLGWCHPCMWQSSPSRWDKAARNNNSSTEYSWHKWQSSTGIEGNVNTVLLT